MNVVIWRFVGAFLMVLGALVLYLNTPKSQVVSIILFVIAAMAWNEEHYLDLKERIGAKSTEMQP
jgi:hypothetical protein